MHSQHLQRLPEKRPGRTDPSVWDSLSAVCERHPPGSRDERSLFRSHRGSVADHRREGLQAQESQTTTGEGTDYFSRESNRRE